jgi:hypothetical protein
LCEVKFDGLVKSRKIVTPEKAGVQNLMMILDARLRGHDAETLAKTFYDSIKFE